MLGTWTLVRMVARLHGVRLFPPLSVAVVTKSSHDCTILRVGAPTGEGAATLQFVLIGYCKKRKRGYGKGDDHDGAAAA